MPGWELHDFTVVILPNTHPQRICNSVDGEIGTGETRYIECVHSLLGQGVMIEKSDSGIFSICEVAVYGTGGRFGFFIFGVRACVLASAHTTECACVCFE